MCARRRGLWGRQGRHRLRPVRLVGGRAGTAHPPLRGRDLRSHRSHSGHPGPRRRHRLAGDGLDHGHLQHEKRLRRARGGDRQTPPAGRLARSRGGHRTWTAGHHPRGASPPRTTTRGARVVIQGFGNVGSNAARMLASAGARIVAVSDVRGGIIRQDGLDISRLIRYRHETGGVEGYHEAGPLTNAELLELECDVLLPAAMEGQITEANADRIGARLIVEGANGPTTSEADAILAARGITVVPDIMANAGGVVVSYFEWVQDRNGYFWKEDDVNARLEEKMVAAYDAVSAAAERFGLGRDLRAAAYVVAMQRILEARRLRGLYA